MHGMWGWGNESHRQVGHGMVPGKPLCCRSRSSACRLLLLPFEAPELFFCGASRNKPLERGGMHDKTHCSLGIRDLEIWRFGDLEIWRFEDLEIYRAIPPRGPGQQGLPTAHCPRQRRSSAAKQCCRRNGTQTQRQAPSVTGHHAFRSAIKQAAGAEGIIKQANLRKGPADR